MIKKVLHILLLLFFGQLTAQINTTQTVFFDLDKSSLSKKELNRILCYLDSTNSSEFKSVQLYGYCDDRGTVDYNVELSKKRVDYVQKILISKGISQDRIVVYEGKGEVNLITKKVKNLKEIRDKNRRVDFIFVKNIVQTGFPENPKVGDIIILDSVLFEMGSSELTNNAKKELDRVIVKLKIHKTIHFQIKGHVCCTSSKFKDAVDNETQNRNLSENRAKNVFNYLRSQDINPYRMSYKGYGNLFPLGKEDTQDRRVELYITKL